MLRKIGGIYWLRLGRVRVSFCLTRPMPASSYPAQRLMRLCGCRSMSRIG